MSGEQFARGGLRGRDLALAAQRVDARGLAGVRERAARELAGVLGEQLERPRRDVGGEPGPVEQRA